MFGPGQTVAVLMGVRQKETGTANDEKTPDRNNREKGPKRVLLFMDIAW